MYRIDINLLVSSNIENLTEVFNDIMNIEKDISISFNPAEPISYNNITHDVRRVEAFGFIDEGLFEATKIKLKSLIDDVMYFSCCVYIQKRLTNEIEEGGVTTFIPIFKMKIDL